MKKYLQFKGVKSDGDFLTKRKYLESLAYYELAVAKKWFNSKDKVITYTQ